MINRLIDNRRRAGELRRRQVPGFGTHQRPGPTTVYYVARDSDVPNGGVRAIYRHVDALNAQGVPAAVLHNRANFRCTWFTNSTRVVHGGAVSLGPDDILVVPEWYGPGLHRIPVGPRVVVFNRRAYDTFDQVSFAGSAPGSPYRNTRGLIALLTVSRDNADFLRYSFPDVPVHLTRNVIDPAVFHPGPTGEAGRPRRIAFTTNRRPAERDHLLHVLRSRGVLVGWELVPITGRTERETADLMRDSALFLSFSEREGFGLPPAEAMASGCYVVGYPGLAGREFFDPSYCTPVPDEDLAGFARAVEEACLAYASDPDTLTKRARAASERVLTHYTADGLSNDLEAFYRPLVTGGG